MIGKVHSLSGKKIFACCDKELIDKKLNQKGLEIHISKSFYGTSAFTEKAFLEQVKECDQANIFGNKACDILIKEKIISKDQIIYIDKIAHIQIYKI